MTEDERRAYQREWARKRREDPEYRALQQEKDRARRAANPEKYRAKDRAKYAKNPEASKERTKRYLAAHRDEINAAKREIRSTPEGKAKTAEESRRYRKSRLEWAKNHRESVNAAKRRRYQERRAEDESFPHPKTPEQKIAHQAVQSALRYGLLVRPAVCERCGSDRTIDAHHADYSRPLDVEWLCRSCHINSPPRVQARE